MLRSASMLVAVLGLSVFAAGCGGGEQAPFFPDALGPEPMTRTLEMKHGFSLLLVDEEPARVESSFDVRFKAAEPLSWSLSDGGYQDGVGLPAVMLNGSPASMATGTISGTDAAPAFAITVRKAAGQPTKSSHQVRLDVFGNGPLESEAVTKVELAVKGPAGARWSLSEHPGRVRASGP